MNRIQFKRLTSLLVIFTFVVGFLTPAIPSVKAAEVITVAEAIANNSGTATVEGYIVAHTTGTNSYDFEAPFGSDYNFAMADTANETDPSKIFPVQITSEFRSQFGLQTNPTLIGEKVQVTGSLEPYFNVPALKSPTAFTLVDGGSTNPEPGTTISIAEARAAQNSVTVTVEGIITSTTAGVYVQDSTGGINLYSQSDATAFVVGDQVKVTGNTASYKGLKEITNYTVEVISSGNALPEVQSISLADLMDNTAEQYEGELVKLTGYVSSVPSSPAGGGYNVSIIDSEFNSTTLRVMESTNAIGTIQKGTWYEFTGVLSQYDSYQLLPRSSSDVALLENQPEAPSAAGEYPAVVANVVDGDTINIVSPVLGSTKVRYVNIDSPETFNAVNQDPARAEINANQKELGEASKAYMNELLQAGDEIILKIGDEPTDAYGRLLAQVIRQSDNLNTNLEMVRKGQAVTYFIDPIGDEETYNQFQAAVKEAKDSELGIWSETNPLLELPFVFRTNDDNGIFDKFVGNSDTKVYVAPDKWENVPVEKRIFFWTEADAQAAGYTAETAVVEDPNGSEDNIALQLLSLNDLHGKIDQVYQLDTNGDGTNETVAQMDYVAAYLKQRESTNPNTLIVHAGDMIGGSSPISALLQDEPTVEIMEAIGFDVGTVGNHEFDEGTEELLRMVNGGEHPNAKGTENYDGMNFPVLCANCISNETGEPILPAYSIEVVEGVKVGFIGVNTKQTATMVIPSGIQDLTFTDEAVAVNKAVAELQAKGVNAIIVLAHMPASQSGTSATGDAANLANSVHDEVDVIFAAHNHEVVNALVDNKLIVQALDYGKAFADVDLELDPTTQDIVKKEAEIVYVDHSSIQPDGAVAGILSKYENQVSEIMNEVVGFAEVALTGGYGIKGPFGDNAAGNLIADGMAWAMESDFALMNGGGIRDSINAGEITWAELFNVQPFGNTLVKIEVTGAELETILNSQISRTYGPEVSIGGFEYTWSGATNKLVDIYLPDGSTIDKSATYTVTVNNYMYEHGSDKYKLRALGENPVQGPIDLDATVDFVKSFEGESIFYEAEGRFSEIVLGDEIAPVTEATVTDAYFSNGAYLEEAVVELSATEEENAVLRIEYSLDEGQTWNKYRNPLTIKNDGKTTIQYRAIDTARNTEEVKTIEVVVVAPTLTNVGEMIESSDANHGVKTSILTQIHNIQKELEKGKVEHAYKQLEQLEDRVQMQNSKTINEHNKADIVKLLNYIQVNNKL
jgi:2',3'-cyclic-nucleotide 2'-phosphodiesterase (5'-nucleotidase family)/endonuclease YncB( thermonuclease family)/ribosomal protein S20